MTFGILGWKVNFQANLNCTPKRRWMKIFYSFSRSFWGPKASQNWEVWSGLDHYIGFHPFWCIQSGKSGGIISRDRFYRCDLVWKNEVWNLSRVFWGIKWCFLGVNIYFFSITPFHAIINTNTFPTTHKLHQSESICKSDVTHKLNFLFSHL